MDNPHFMQSIKRTVRSFGKAMPIILGVVLLSSLILEWVPPRHWAALFGGNGFVDALAGVTAGSVALGNPVASYVLAGELNNAGVSLIAVTGLIVSWVTVGIVQLPAEMLILGRRFALLRNLVSFALAFFIAFAASAIYALSP